MTEPAGARAGEDVCDERLAAIQAHRKGTADAELFAAIREKLNELTALRAQIEGLRAWCDERRNAPTVTTLGMVQAQIDALLSGQTEKREGEG